MFSEDRLERLEKIVERNGKTDQPLVGQDGNAFFILGNFQKYARRAGWSQEDIEEVIEIAKSGDYDNLLATIMQTTDNA